jgi:uncharacterized protein YndB with AHSA1/START domain
MNAVDKTVRGQTETLCFEFDLKHPPEKVWRALTDPRLLSQWLLPVLDFELRPGAAFKFKADWEQPDWDGIVNCRLVEIETYRKLSYRWTASDLDTVVTFTLSPTASGTRLSLVQSGFEAHHKQAFGGARYGWKLMGQKLIDLLDKEA